MTEIQKELARHALGLDGKRRESYRNHFVTSGPGGDWQQWMEMVAAGDAVKGRASELTGGDDVFLVTRQGAKAVLLKRERLSREHF